MSGWELYLALIVALIIGFWQGKRHASRRERVLANSPNHQYFQGLNFLLNEQPDAAIESFIKALEVNSETLETHLALGKLLRNRGEVDKAIRIHQNLLARPGLTRDQSQQAQYELATDFAKAGLLDRAEGLLKTLVKEGGDFQLLGLQRLLEVYQDEKEWEQGLKILQLLSGSRFSKSYEQWAAIRAHFCCELAETAIGTVNHSAARQWLKQALIYDKQSVRASLLLGRLDIAMGNTQRGVQQLRKIAEQNLDYLPEALPYLLEGYRELGDLKKYSLFLAEAYQQNASSVVMAELTDMIAKQEGERAAVEFIAQEVKVNPSGMGLHKLLDYYLRFADGKTQEHLSALKLVMERVISRCPSYQCQSCGFKGQRLHWLCPSCKQWGVVKPVKNIGD